MCEKNIWKNICNYVHTLCEVEIRHLFAKRHNVENYFSLSFPFSFTQSVSLPILHPGLYLSFLLGCRQERCNALWCILK